MLNELLPKIASLKDIEKIYIKRTLEIFGWNKTYTAVVLGISNKTLYNKIKKYEIRNEVNKEVTDSNKNTAGAGFIP